jgi:acetylornithine/succinyldiaminopimelate/putrescine aminotransferase
LTDLLGRGYTDAVCSARARLTGEDEKRLTAIALQKVDFYPRSMQRAQQDLLPRVGSALAKSAKSTALGASSESFTANTKRSAAPLSGYGVYRIGEDGRLYFIAKSEHYHAPLGHGFPGFQLVDFARQLGIPNATHNNTRGHITRLLEEELVRVVAGIAPDDRAAVRRQIGSSRTTLPNRVLNLETGSLAVEAALKMVLSRFYKAQADSPDPVYKGRIPVVIVLGDEEGGLRANYHGTTMLTQCMRGMWGDLRTALEAQGALVVRSVRPNDTAELEAVFKEYEKKPYKIAGFFHELVLMNYAGKRLTRQFIRNAYALCRKHDVPTVVDEIQSCMWSPKLFLFREYGLKPNFVAVGKGFPGGEYPASRILFNSSFDTLPQFGALVTNGQEELASLSYLITMRWAEVNADVTSDVGETYERGLKALASRYSHLISAIEGRRHLAGVYFHDLAPAQSFAKSLNNDGLDISVQTYKAGCPPSALTKLPLITTHEMVEFILAKMEAALKRI